jgi:hypothetical protein
VWLGLFALTIQATRDRAMAGEYRSAHSSPSRDPDTEREGAAHRAQQEEEAEAHRHAEEMWERQQAKVRPHQAGAAKHRVCIQQTDSVLTAVTDRRRPCASHELS